jgi:D-alanyl-D-alanine carboxypeptidase
MPYRLAMNALIALLALAAGADAGAPAGALDATLRASFPADEPGVVALVRRGTEVLLRRGYGLADREAGKPLEPEHVLRIGSVTKQFTAAAVMLLVESGKVSLDDEIGKYVPSYNRAGVTVQRLLSHTAGVPSYTDRPGWIGRMAQDLGPEQILASFKDLPLEFAPGQRWRYSNSGYYLLGLLIEKVSGQSYPQFLATHIFQPLGMKHTGYGDDPALGPLARGYERSGGRRIEPAATISMRQPFSAGGLRSTVDDLARWDAAISAGKLLSSKGWQRVFTPVRLPDGKDSRYGFGWFIRDEQGHRIEEHGGGIPGFNSEILRDPDEQVVVVLLANSLPAATNLAFLAKRLRGIAVGRPVSERQDIILPVAQLDGYLGRYELAPGFVLTVSREGQRMFAQATGQPRAEIFASARQEFFLKVVDAQLSFQVDDKGQASAVTLHQGGRDLVGKRIK